MLHNLYILLHDATLGTFLVSYLIILILKRTIFHFQFRNFCSLKNKSEINAIQINSP